jgi:hypothetical protein
MKKIALSLIALLIIPDTRLAYAVQEHTAGEGYIVHQSGHILFLLAMVYMIAMLGKPLLARLAGWRYIRLAAFFFLLWNLDTIVSHTAEALLGPREGYMHGSFMSVTAFKAAVYYYTRLIENFFLVPAFVFMALGLARLKKQLMQEPET